MDFSWNPHYESEFLWYDQSLVNAARQPDNGVENMVLTFFELLALCHTVMPNWKNGEVFMFKIKYLHFKTGNIWYSKHHLVDLMVEHSI